MKSIQSKILALSVFAITNMGVAASASTTANNSLSQDSNIQEELMSSFLSSADFNLNRDRRGHDDRRGRDDRDRRDRDGRGRDDRDRRDRDGRGRDDFDRGRGGCRDEAVTLLCKVDNQLRNVRAYTDCQYTREGDICSYVTTPGYRQTSMRIAFRCERGRFVWILGENGMCKLR